VTRSTATSLRQGSIAGAAHVALRRPANWLQLAKFCIVGASGYALNLGVFSALVHGAGVNYLLAAAVAFVIAVSSNYTWNRLWTFRAQRGHVGFQGLRFLAVSLSAFGVNAGLLAVLVEAGVDKVPAQAAAIVAVTPFSFLANKLWSFRR
jgi:putative flippase GtrA